MVNGSLRGRGDVLGGSGEGRGVRINVYVQVQYKIALNIDFKAMKN